MFIESSRIGVFRALIDRVAALHVQEESVLEVRVPLIQLTSISKTSFIIYRQCILVAFEISNDEDRKLVVPCILRLLPIQVCPCHWFPFLTDSYLCFKPSIKRNTALRSRKRSRNLMAARNRLMARKARRMIRWNPKLRGLSFCNPCFDWGPPTMKSL